MFRQAGLMTLRYGLSFLLVLWGAFKFAAFEAEGIQPLICSTPGVLEPTNPSGGFLMKDLLLLGAALFTAGEALGAGLERAR